MREKIKNLEEFRVLQEKYIKARSLEKRKVLVCCGTGCTAGGNLAVYEELKKQMAAHGAAYELSLTEGCGTEATGIKKSGCHGFCEMGPLVRIEPEGWLYTKVHAGDVEEIVEKTLLGGEFIERLGYHQNGQLYKRQEDIPFYKKQTRRVLEHCGHIDAESIEEYFSIGGYTALTKALFEMSGDEVIAEVTDSGLRGRGGAGFPTGKKWSFAAAQPEGEKFIICNADEGDPGAFMDRAVLEGDPNAVLEAMAIGGYAIGAHNGVIYIRAEYPLAVKRLENAIAQAEEKGFLGKNIFGSGFDFKLEIKFGAGAFVCGEETALIHSIEGQRGEPTFKPPFPAIQGLWKRPTVVNNVETYACIAAIIRKGADWFKGLGTAGSPGTKVFALAGKISKVGLAEVPMGMTLRQIIYEIGGGIKDGREFKAVQTGGPSGGCITKKNLDLQIDYEALKSIGSMMGSGGMIVMDEDDCMVNIAKFFLDFTADESCGKCPPCRVGNRRMLELLNKITSGEGNMEILEKLKTLSATIKDTALCGLGQTAPNPVLSTLANFEDEYLAHVKDHRCPAGVCANLIQFNVTDKCVGCGLCAKRCPVGAISGEKKMKHVVNQAKCIKCGACFGACKFHAIAKI